MSADLEMMADVAMQYARTLAHGMLGDELRDLPEYELLVGAFTLGFMLAWKKGQDGELLVLLETLHSEATG